MRLLYEGNGEIVCFDIDRENKKFKLLSSKTNFKFIERPWKELFDKGIESKQDEVIEKLSDKEFIQEITYYMKIAGYIYRKYLPKIK